MKMTRILAAVLAVSLSAADWPQWRGPDRDGHAAREGLPTNWPRQLDLAWKVEAGEGHSGPVVAGQRVFVQTRVQDDEVLQAFDRESGKLLWTAKDPTPVRLDPAVGKHGNIVRSTPCVADNKIYTLSVSGTVICRDLNTGKEIWRKGYDRKPLEKPWPLFGAATSPIVIEGKCIVWLGGHDEGALSAFDARTGQLLWDRPGDGPGYSSPIVVAKAGQTVLVTQSQVKRNVIDLKTGDVIDQQKFTTAYDQNSISPVNLDGLIIDSGYRQPIVAHRLNDKMQLETQWSIPRHSLYMSTPVAVGGQLLALSQRSAGTILSIDGKTGQVRWESDGRFGDYAAFIVAGSHVLIQNVQGKLFVLPSDATRFDPIVEYKVADGPTWAHPALAGKRLWVKDHSQLYCWNIP